MSCRIKGLFNQVKAASVSFEECPPVFTKENINTPCVKYSLLREKLRALECLVYVFVDARDIVKYALDLGAEITEMVTNISKPIYYKILFEAGVDPNHIVAGHTPLIQLAFIHRSATLEEIRVIIDYGGTMPKRWNPRDEARMLPYLEQYALLSDSRVATSRKSLCALLWCSKRSFIPLRGIILELAKQAWAQKGGEGCGPRGHEWVDEKK